MYLKLVDNRKFTVYTYAIFTLIGFYMTDMTQTPPPAARLTLDDVRAALAGTDPNQTNANKVRAILGNRGSFETIQKHLGTLRAERGTAAAASADADQVPVIPAEAARAMWAAAWTAAQVQTLRRTEALAAERDAALLKLETMDSDITGLVATVDEQAAKLEGAAATATTVQAAHLLEVARLGAELSAANELIERNRVELDKVRADAAHAAELAESGRAMMREEMARLTDQVGELKANLYKRAKASSASNT